jgi:Sugar-binding cellulase-like
MKPSFQNPYAITMWDFSWLERRWPGAGYEDPGLALDELAERGYDAVRIDAYPHLVSADPYREWTLHPQWNQQVWGAPALTTVTVLPALLEFIAAARDRGIRVGLSTWYRRDLDQTVNAIRTPEDQARIWIDTLGHIEAAGLLDNILYVDLCNEFPMTVFAPYMYPEAALDAPIDISNMRTRTDPEVAAWMADSIALVRREYPDLDYTFSFAFEYGNWPEQDVAALDFLEPHIWMASPETSDFYEKVGYGFQPFDPTGYENLVKNGYREYSAGKTHYDEALTKTIELVADWSRGSGKPLCTTECWSVVDYKDWPGLDWGWVKDLTAHGVRTAAATGRWVGMATSNFCGPQFVGMWRDVEWHRDLTTLIKESAIDQELRR